MKPEVPVAPVVQKQVVEKQQHIPFRTDSAVAAADLLGILMLTVALLSVAAAGLYWAKKKGMIPAWLNSQNSANNQAALKKLESLRISPSTVVHRFSDGSKIYVLAESTRNIAMTTTQSAVPESGDEK